jgi:hypothetical protein
MIRLAGARRKITKVSPDPGDAGDDPQTDKFQGTSHAKLPPYITQRGAA